MIELTPLARPYAKALFSSALESENLDEMANDLKIMATASKTEEIKSTIEDPVLSRQEVVEILTKLFDENVGKTSKKLLSILAENKRLNLLEPIYSIYQELLEKHKEQNSIEVFVATTPSDEAKEDIERSFFDVSPTFSSNSLVKISTTSCLDNTGSSIVLFISSVFETVAMIFRSFAISSKFSHSSAEENNAFA